MKTCAEIGYANRWINQSIKVCYSWVQTIFLFSLHCQLFLLISGYYTICNIKITYQCKIIIVPEEGWFGQPKYSTPTNTLCRLLLLFSTKSAMPEGKLIIIPALGHLNKGKSSFTGSALFVLMSQCGNNNELALQHGGFCTT